MIEAQLQALRDQGAPQRDPLRWRQLEALARRIPVQPKAVQCVLMQRFAATVAACQARLDSGAAPMVSPGVSRDRVSSVLRQLLRDIEDRGQAPWQAVPVVDRAEPGVGPPLRSVQRFGALWSRLSAERQLAEAVARGPMHAGPLNSHSLMLRVLTLMNGLSPDYLHRYLAQVDTLLWLERANQQTSLRAPKVERKARTKGAMSRK